MREQLNQPLDAVYPIVYPGCIVLKVRQDSRVINKSVFLALNIEGQKELPGMWLGEKSLFRILCKCLFSEVTVKAVTKLNNKAAHCHSPVTQRHCPFLDAVWIASHTTFLLTRPSGTLCGYLPDKQKTSPG